VHRGQTEPAELSGCAHVHAARDALAGVADQLRVFRPDAVIDTRAMTRADADAVLPHLPDAHLVLLSSIDVYRAYELLLAGRGGEPVPLTETSPVRSARYPLRDLLPGLGEHYDKLDVEPLYLSRGGCVLRLSLIYGGRSSCCGGFGPGGCGYRSGPAPRWTRAAMSATWLRPYWPRWITLRLRRARCSTWAT
jgi:hypothetical protein